MHALRSLQHRNFLLLWLGLIVSNLGSQLQMVALGWIVIKLAVSPLQLGLFGLSSAIPFIIFPPFGGALADRFSKKKILYFVQMSLALLAALLWVLALTSMLQLWHIFVIAFLSSAVSAVDNPTRLSLLPLLVSRENLVNAIATNSMAWTGSALIGPALAGALIAVVGTTPMFLMNAISFGAMIIALMLMDVEEKPVKRREHMLREIGDGIHYALSHKLIRAVLLILAIYSFVGRSVIYLVPIFAEHIWKGGVVGYGMLLAASGAGALVGGIIVARYVNLQRAGVILLVSGFLLGLTLALFAISPTMKWGYLFIFLNGAASLVSGMTMASLVQYHVPDELRGRVMSLYTVTWIGIPSLGALGSTAVSEMFGGFAGAPMAVFVGAVLVMLATVAGAKFFLGIRLSGKG